MKSATAMKRKKQRLNKQITTTQKCNRKSVKSCRFASLVSDCLSTNSKRRQVTVKSSEKRLKCKIEPRCNIKSLQVRKTLESNIVARRGLMIAKMPAENDFVRFKKMKALYKLASAAEYRVVGNVFGIHKSSVHNCLHR